MSYLNECSLAAQTCSPILQATRKLPIPHPRTKQKYCRPDQQGDTRIWVTCWICGIMMEAGRLCTFWAWFANLPQLPLRWRGDHGGWWAAKRQDAIEHSLQAGRQTRQTTKNRRRGTAGEDAGRFNPTIGNFVSLKLASVLVQSDTGEVIVAQWHAVEGSRMPRFDPREGVGRMACQV